jgi:hypothetical protein
VRRVVAQYGAQTGSAGRALALSRARNRAGFRNDQVRRSSCASLYSTRDSGKPLRSRVRTSDSGAASHVPPAARIVSCLLPSCREPSQPCFASRDRAAGPRTGAPTVAPRTAGVEWQQCTPALRSLSASASNRSRSGVHPRELSWACDSGRLPASDSRGGSRSHAGRFDSFGTRPARQYGITALTCARSSGIWRRARPGRGGSTRSEKVRRGCRTLALTFLVAHF